MLLSLLVLFLFTSLSFKNTISSVCDFLRDLALFVCLSTFFMLNYFSPYAVILDYALILGKALCVGIFTDCVECSQTLL